MAEMVKFKGGKEVVERINGGGGENFKTVLAALFTWEMLCPAAVSMARSSCGGRYAVHCLFSRALGAPRCAEQPLTVHHVFPRSLARMLLCRAWKGAAPPAAQHILLALGREK